MEKSRYLEALALAGMLTSACDKNLHTDAQDLELTGQPAILEAEGNSRCQWLDKNCRPIGPTHEILGKITQQHRNTKLFGLEAAQGVICSHTNGINQEIFWPKTEGAPLQADQDWRRKCIEQNLTCNTKNKL